MCSERLCDGRRNECAARGDVMEDEMNVQRKQGSTRRDSERINGESQEEALAVIQGELTAKARRKHSPFEVA